MPLETQQLEATAQGSTTIPGIEGLQQILTMQQRRQVDYDEAEEIGGALIEFYSLLAEGLEHEPEQ